MNQVDPQKSKRKESKQKSKEALGKLGIDLSALDLSEHEEIIASEVVAADEIQVTFKGALETAHLVSGRTLTAWSRRRRRTRPDHLAAPGSRHLPAVLPSAV